MEMPKSSCLKYYGIITTKYSKTACLPENAKISIQQLPHA